MVTSIKGNDTSTFGGNIDVTGNVVTDAPAFSARLQVAQTLSNNTWTKIVFNTEILDSASAYNTSTGNFQPTLAGWYQFNSALRYGGNTTGFRHLSIYVNGTTEYRLIRQNTGDGTQSLSGSCLIYLNGSTDYASVYGLQSSGGNLDLSTDVINANIFQGFLVRAV
jgi:hypothetical protein